MGETIDLTWDQVLAWRVGRHRLAAQVRGHRPADHLAGVDVDEIQSDRRLPNQRLAGTGLAVLARPRLALAHSTHHLAEAAQHLAQRLLLPRAPLRLVGVGTGHAP